MYKYQGRGYLPALKASDRMHGVAQFDIPTGQQKKGAPGQPTYTSYFSNTLCELARQVDVELIVETVLMCCVAVCCSALQCVAVCVLQCLNSGAGRYAQLSLRYCVCCIPLNYYSHVLCCGVVQGACCSVSTVLQ